MVSAPIQTGKGPRGAARWRKGGGPWCYGKPPKVFVPAPKELQHARSATRAGLPVYAAHRPINASEIKSESARGGEDKLVHIRGERSKHDDAAMYYTHHGDVVVNGVLRGTAKHQEARLTLTHEEEGVRLNRQIQDHDMKHQDIADRARSAASAQGTAHPSYRQIKKELDASYAEEARLQDLMEGWHIKGSERVNVEQLARVTAKKLDEFIGARTLKTDATLFRGGVFPVETVAALKPGAVFVDRGYPSTTITPTVVGRFARAKDAGERGVIFHVRARKGQTAAFMEPYTQHAGEDEVLLPRGTKFRVVEHRVPDAQWMPHTIVVEIE